MPKVSNGDEAPKRAHPSPIGREIQWVWKSFVCFLLAWILLSAIFVGTFYKTAPDLSLQEVLSSYMDSYFRWSLIRSAIVGVSVYFAFHADLIFSKRRSS